MTTTRLRALRDRYLPALTLALLLCGGVSAQTNYYEPISKAFQWKGGYFTRTMGLPADTVTLDAAEKLRPHVAYKSGTLYVWSPTAVKWLPTGSGGGGTGTLATVLATGNDGGGAAITGVSSVQASTTVVSPTLTLTSSGTTGTLQMDGTGGFGTGTTITFKADGGTVAYESDLVTPGLNSVLSISGNAGGHNITNVALLSATNVEGDAGVIGNGFFLKDYISNKYTRLVPTADLSANSTLYVPAQDGDTLATKSDVAAAVAGAATPGLGAVLTQSNSAAGSRITNLGAPTGSADAVRKQDLDNAIAATGNFGNTNLTFSGNRNHNAKGYSLTVDSLFAGSFQGSGYADIALRYESGSSIGTVAANGNATLTSSLTSGGAAFSQVDVQPNNIALRADSIRLRYAFLGPYRPITSDTAGFDLMALNRASGAIVRVPSALIGGSSGGSNFATADLRLTGNRTHSIAGNELTLDSATAITLRSTDPSGQVQLQGKDGGYIGDVVASAGAAQMKATDGSYYNRLLLTAKETQLEVPDTLRLKNQFLGTYTPRSTDTTGYDVLSVNKGTGAIVRVPVAAVSGPALSVTTTGSGAATFSGGVLNIPTPVIPTDNSSLSNGSGYVTAPGARSAVATTVGTGLVKSNGSALSAAVAGTDYAAPRNMSTGMSWYSDFLSTAGGEYNIQASGTGATVSMLTPTETNRFGVLDMTTGTTATGWSGLYLGNASAFSTLRLGGASYTLETSVRVNTLSDATNTNVFYFGFINAIATDQTNGAYFLYDQGNATGLGGATYWQTVTKSGNVATVNQSHTQVTVTAGSWVNLKVVVNAAATQAQFYVNGTLIATHTTNIPLSTNVGVGYSIRKTAGTTARTTDVDYLDFNGTFTTPR